MSFATASSTCVVDAHRIGPLVRFALATGLRQGELLGLRLANVDTEAMVAHVRGTLTRADDEGRYELMDTTKTVQSRRTVPLGKTALAALREEGRARAGERLAAGSVWAVEPGLVFASPIGTPLHPRNVVRSWHELCDLAGIDRRPFHHLRHTSATYLLTGGLPMEAVSRLLGHSSVAVTSNVYAEVRDLLTAPAAAVIDAAMHHSMGGLA